MGFVEWLRRSVQRTDTLIQCLIHFLPLNTVIVHLLLAQADIVFGQLSQKITWMSRVVHEEQHGHECFSRGEDQWSMATMGIVDVSEELKLRMSCCALCYLIALGDPFLWASDLPSHSAAPQNETPPRPVIPPLLGSLRCGVTLNH